MLSVYTNESAVRYERTKVEVDDIRRNDERSDEWKTTTELLRTNRKNGVKPACFMVGGLSRHTTNVARTNKCKHKEQQKLPVKMAKAPAVSVLAK